VAPLSAVALVTNVVIAPWINHERLSRWDIAGILLICAGSAVAIIFSGVVAPEYKLCVLLNLLQRPATVAFLCVIGSGVLVLWVFIRVMERRLDRSHRDGIVDTARDDRLPVRSGTAVTAGTLSSSSPVGQLWARLRAPSHRRSGSLDTTASTAHTSATATPAWHSPAVLKAAQDEDEHTAPVNHAPVDPPSGNMDAIMEEYSELPEAVPAAECDQARTADVAAPTAAAAADDDDKDDDTVASRYLLPLAYASLGGLMGTLTTLFAKSLINLFTASIAGDNQFTKFLSWVIFVVTVTTAVSQVFWINMGLRRYDALLQVPVFYTVWTLMDIIGGAVYYDEFEFFGPKQYALFSLGVVLIFTGVGLLSKRLKQVEESNLAEARARQRPTPAR
jgi:membrane protein implicated in regulation of membrane protease activity